VSAYPHTTIYATRIDAIILVESATRQQKHLVVVANDGACGGITDGEVAAVAGLRRLPVEQHTSAYVSIRAQKTACRARGGGSPNRVSIGQHRSA
jgi:hypothetical protein